MMARVRLIRFIIHFTGLFVHRCKAITSSPNAGIIKTDSSFLNFRKAVGPLRRMADDRDIEEFESFTLEQIK